MLLTDIALPVAVDDKVAQMNAMVFQPLEAAFNDVSMSSCSIGVACYPVDGEDADTLMSRADVDLPADEAGYFQPCWVIIRFNCLS